MAVEAFEFTQYTDKPVRRKAWTIRVHNATLDLEENLKPGAVLKDVDGTIYEEDNGVTTVHGDQAKADRKSPILSLSKNVYAKSASREARLTCDALKWDPDRRILMATGNVRYHGMSMEMGPFPELWASPDLQLFGTPDTFTKGGALKP